MASVTPLLTSGWFVLCRGPTSVLSYRVNILYILTPNPMYTTWQDTQSGFWFSFTSLIKQAIESLWAVNLQHGLWMGEVILELSIRRWCTGLSSL